MENEAIPLKSPLITEGECREKKCPIDSIDISLDNLGQAMIEVQEKMDKDPHYRKKMSARIS